ncbi:innexin domain-containing protein [Ditylenchus destructor]|nr:innexin domain-containing protein [Ditylenchus destructor]
MIGAIAPYITRIRRSYQSNDIIDRLNYQYTAMMISLSAITLAATQYVGKPIQCWVPPEFTGAWEKYAETYCFVKGSYYLPVDEEIDESYSQREKIFIGYYQWVPLVLAGQAMLFYLPSFIWKAMNFNTGINVKSILNSAALVKKKFDKGTRSAQVSKAATHLIEALEMQKELKTSTFILTRLGKRNGVFLTLLYLFTKLLYVGNVVLQFVILNAFLGPQYTFWGVGILSDIWNGKEWSESGHFPRVTLCDFNVRVLGNIHRWTVQCVLMINMFNEKIFIFFWFWFLLVGALSVLSLIYWLFATLLPGQQRGYIGKYLRCTSAISNYPSNREQRLIDDFIRRFLRTDGVFLLRLIQTNGGDLLVGEIITSLFNRYRSKLEEQTGSQVTESPFTIGESPDTTKI